MNGPSNKRFGIEMAAVLAVVSAFRGDLRILAAAVVLLAVALIRAHWLRPLNQAWMRFAGLLQSITSAIFYYLIFTPMAFIARLTGRDPLRQKPQPQSYWIRRDTPVSSIQWHRQF